MTHRVLEYDSKRKIALRDSFQISLQRNHSHHWRSWFSTFSKPLVGVFPVKHPLYPFGLDHKPMLPVAFPHRRLVELSNATHQCGRVSTFNFHFLLMSNVDGLLPKSSYKNS